MGDIQERLSVSSSSSSSSSSLSLSTTQPKRDNPLPIDGDFWMVAEERVNEILSIIQPVIVSDRSRNEIINYLQSIIKSHEGIEVFSFGSVPLKTYLPDGDIDLTVLTKQNVEDTFFEKLYDVLKSEEEKSEFHVTDVQFIPAMVKVIKCNIRNIPVDISFNQTSGLCALCFLEQVDQIFARGHLLKRSIILIKAWCYYESRILGANTGLISTYALAVLVLYIINMFHSSLSGPLSVLYKFLDYYGSFDWSNYMITVNGPMLKSQFPEHMAASPEDGYESLLDETFFRDCIELYSSPTKAIETNGEKFPLRHFNIVDPLKYCNNLGRSVTKGNFQRILHAFTLGARKLRDVLSLPGETMGWRLERFFGNTLERNGKGQRQDVNDPVTAFGTGKSELSELCGDFEGYFERLVYGQVYHDTSAWDVIRNLVSYRKNEFHLRGLNISTTAKTRGTGTYIPDMSHFDRFGSGNSWSHPLEGYVEAIDDDDGESSCCEETNSCACIEGEECMRPETCSSNQSSPPENLVDSISSSTMVMENGKEENSIS